MHRPNAPISLADLAAAGVRLRPYEAVTLVRELILKVARGEVAGVPSSHVIRLSASGALSIEGPVAAGGRSVVRAAQLLDSLLPSADAGNQFRIPGGLKLIVARALGTLDVPAFASLEAFADALSRFSATDPAALVTNLVVTWSEFVASRAPEAAANAPATTPSVTAQVERFVAPLPIEARWPAFASALTVSDIRRARRATGLPLAKVAERSQISLGLLRQLEWGYLANWPGGQYGRTQLVRYARATGLDEQVVIATIVPLIEEAELRQPLIELKPQATGLVVSSVETSAIVETDEIVLAPRPALPLAWPGTVQQQVEPMRMRTKVLAALAIPALLAIGVAPAWWAHSSRQTPDATVAESRQNPGSVLAPAPQPATSRPSPAGSSPLIPTSTHAPTVAVNDQAAVPPPPTRATYRLASDGVAYSPAFASAGTAMFYHAGDEKTALVRADTDSRGAVLRVTRIVDDTAKNFHVRPSPDGRRIAFDSDRDGVRGVYVADADGKNVRRVSPDGFAAVPSWSPDGSSLAFVRANEDRPDVWNLWTLELETGDLTQVTRHKYGQPWGGSWFPDGHRLAYSHEDRLIIHDLLTGRERRFASPRKGRLLRTPAVSPDGRRVMFQVYRDGGWLLELPDGSMRRVLEDATAEEFTWSPDGRRLAYHSRRAGGWGVWVMASR
jgi:hypothetical protein